VIGDGHTPFYTATLHKLDFLGHLEPKILMEFSNTQCNNLRDPCTRVKAALLTAIPRNSASAAAFALTPGVKFTHRLTYEFGAIQEIVRDTDMQDYKRNPAF
jgi:hypothetical protein